MDKTDIKNMQKIRLEDIISKFKETFLLVDDHIIPLVCAVLVGNKLTGIGKPIWLAINGPSSGGKTEILDIFSLLQDHPYQLTYHVGDMTPNTLISGMVGSKDQSLLKKLDGKVMISKDFTTIMQKGGDARRELLSQLREVYDGEFNKEFGTGKGLHWKGKVGYLTAITPIGLELMTEFSTMGERFINYYLEQPDDTELGEMLKKKYKMSQKETEDTSRILREMVAEYIWYYSCRAEELDKPYDLSDDILDEINELAIFATQARSPVQLDFRTKEPISVPVKEKFARFAMQLQALAKVFMVMNDGRDLTQLQRDILRKVALDSIPRTRRFTLQMLTEYNTVGTSAFASRYGLPTPTARSWLSQVSSLGLAQRIPRGGKGQEDGWKLNDYARSMMKKFDGIVERGTNMLDEDEAMLLDTPNSKKEDIKKSIAEAQRHSAIEAIMAEDDIDWTSAELIYEKRQKETIDSGEWFDGIPEKTDDTF